MVRNLHFSTNSRYRMFGHSMTSFGRTQGILFIKQEMFMNQLNSIILEGNVVRQAELSEPAKGFKVCKFPLAVNRFTKNSSGESFEEVSFFDVEAYGKMAEVCEKQSSKGRGVRVVGRLKQNRWKDNDGKNVSKVFIVAEHIEYKPKLTRPADSEAEDNSISGSASTKEDDAEKVENAIPKETQAEADSVSEEESVVF